MRLLGLILQYSSSKMGPTRGAAGTPARSKTSLSDTSLLDMMIQVEGYEIENMYGVKAS